MIDLFTWNTWRRWIHFDYYFLGGWQKYPFDVVRSQGRDERSCSIYVWGIVANEGHSCGWRWGILLAQLASHIISPNQKEPNNPPNRMGTLPETKRSPENRPGPKRKIQSSIFRGYDSFREDSWLMGQDTQGTVKGSFWPRKGLIPVGHPCQ